MSALLAVMKPFLFLIVSIAKSKAIPFSPPTSSIIRSMSLFLARSNGLSYQLKPSMLIDLFLVLFDAETPRIL